MDTRLASLLLVFAIACGGGQQKPPPSAPSNDVVAEPAPAPAPPPPAAPRADGRPAAVTDEMAALAEEMVSAMEKMGADVTAAGTDCVKGAAAIRAGTQHLQPIAQRAKAFEAEMETPEAEEWFKDRYMSRLTGAMGGMMQMAQSCSTDKDFNAAIEEMGSSLDN